MKVINLQLFGSRGASSGRNGGATSPSRSSSPNVTVRGRITGGTQAQQDRAAEIRNSLINNEDMEVSNITWSTDGDDIVVDYDYSIGRGESYTDVRGRRRTRAGTGGHTRAWIHPDGSVDYSV